MMIKKNQKPFGHCDRQNNAPPKDVQILIPRNSDYVNYMAKSCQRNWGCSSADLKTERLFRWPQYNHKDPSKWEREAQKRSQQPSLALKMDGSHGSGNADSL